MERAGLNSIEAGYGPSVYFALRTIGAFLGAFMLAKYSSSKFYKINVAVMVIALTTLIFASDKFLIFGLYRVIGFSIANVFPFLFGLAIQSRPDKANEISGLMITGVFGGAILPFFMGLMSGTLGLQVGAVIVILAGALYLLFAGFIIKPDH